MVTKEKLASTIDHSVVGTVCRKAAIENAAKEVLEYGFPALFVMPCDVAYAKELIGDKATVGAAIGFPQGMTTTAAKIFEGLEAMDNGAMALDVVMNVSRLKDGDDEYVSNELKAFVKAAKEKNPAVEVRVIIECPFLEHDEKIKACEIVAECGADYVKETTGFAPNNYHLGDIKIMKNVVGDRCKVKASGWMINVEDAIGAIEFGAERIGNDQAVRWLKEMDDNRYYK